MVVERIKLSLRNQQRFLDNKPIYTLCTRRCCKWTVIVVKVASVKWRQKISEIHCTFVSIFIVVGACFKCWHYLIEQLVLIRSVGWNFEKDPNHGSSLFSVRITMNNMDFKRKWLSIYCVFWRRMEMELKRLVQTFCSIGEIDLKSTCICCGQVGLFELVSVVSFIILIIWAFQPKCLRYCNFSIDQVDRTLLQPILTCRKTFSPVCSIA